MVLTAEEFQQVVYLIFFPWVNCSAICCVSSHTELGGVCFLQFVTSLKDNLNAEVVLGTVTNVKEASTWLGYTYLFVRMLKNPLVYGMTWEEVRI